MNKAVQVTIRCLSVLFVFLACAIYLSFLQLAFNEWGQNQHIHETSYRAVKFILADSIFGSGLPPLVSAIYFFAPGRDVKSWLIGLSVTAGSILFHAVTFAYLAHGPDWLAWSFLLTEAVFVSAAIYFHWRKFKPRSSEAA